MNVVFTPEFKHNLQQLAKRYRHIKADLDAVLIQLQAGQALGDRVRDTQPFAVYKVRAKNSDSGRGKSGGYRLIYWQKSSDLIVLLTIYSKSDQGNITGKEIAAIIRQSGF